MQDKLNKIIQADCLEYLEHIPKQSINMILLDPPYNISHAKWDKWKIQNEYIEWLGSVFLECQRVLKDNGSFYFWHNDFQQMAQLQQWISQNTKFIFNSMISWIKPNFRPIAWKNKKEDSSLRSWFNIQEYCLYYTFKDSGSGLNVIQPLYFKKYLTYMTEQKNQINWACQDFNIFLGYKSIASHWFYNADNIQLQPRFITKKDYEKLQTTGFFQKTYEELRAEYEELRAEYEELRPRFNIQNGQDCNNVWYSKTHDAFGKGKLHTCEKPQDLLQKIILTSTNENDIVLDCFAGGGSTAIASLETKRNFLCCEKEEKYVKIANERIEKHNNQLL